MSARPRAQPRRLVRTAVLTLLAIEFLDELVFGLREAAWPLIRTELGLTYAQVGLLLGLPGVFSSLVEPLIGILGDVWRRRALILGGGAVFCLALILTSASQGFWLLLVSFLLFYPASGAFVSLSQASLMDLEPERHEQNMARWTLAGSLGILAGSMILSAGQAFSAGWRPLFLAGAGLGLILLLAARRLAPAGHRLARPDRLAGGPIGRNLRAGLVNALHAFGRENVLRWLVLLSFSDLMLDVLLGFVALYFADVVGVSEARAGIAVVVWTGVGLLGDFLLLPLLDRVCGLRYLRLSAAVELVLLPAMLLVPGWWPKLALLGLLGLFNAGWYSILKAQLYSAMPGQSGTVMAVDNVFGLVGSLIPLCLGLVAQRVGLEPTMWLLLLGPSALLLGIPRQRPGG